MRGSILARLPREPLVVGEIYFFPSAICIFINNSNLSRLVRDLVASLRPFGGTPGNQWMTFKWLR